MKRREIHWEPLDLEMPISIYNNIIRTFSSFFPLYLSFIFSLVYE